jgi:hypothetical protein
MGLWQKAKETIKKEWNREDDWASKAGKKLGEGIGYVGSRLHEKYKERFAGGEYREARIKELELKAKEAQARMKISKAQSQEVRYKQQKEIKPTKGVLFGSDNTPDYAFIAGQSNKKKNDPYAHLFGEKKL